MQKFVCRTWLHALCVSMKVLSKTLRDAKGRLPRPLSPFRQRPEDVPGPHAMVPALDRMQCQGHQHPLPIFVLVLSTTVNNTCANVCLASCLPYVKH